MRVLRRSGEDEMIAVFLRGELGSGRWSAAIDQALEDAGADRTLVLEADLSDPPANAARRRLLAAHRAYPTDGLFGRFPHDVDWKWVALTRDELLAVRYIDWSYWNELSGGTRLPTDAARRLRDGVEPYGVTTTGFFELAADLAAGKRFSELILVDGSRGLVVLEGHARLTAYALGAAALPSELEVLVGSSPRMCEWALY